MSNTTQNGIWNIVPYRKTSKVESRGVHTRRIINSTFPSDIVKHGYPQHFSYEINERTGEVIIIDN